MFADIGLPTLTKVVPPDPLAPPQVEHDGYPAVLVDQRHAYGVETVAEIENFWLTELDRKHVEPFTRTPFDEVDAYINRLRLLVDCPACNSGAYAWNRNMLACCLDCGLLMKVRHPSPFVLADAVRLLAVRPVVNANWNAHKGETLEELECENRWLLGESSVEKNGLVVPVGLNVPDALAKYVDPKVA